MILSRDYTRVRLAALPDNVIERFLKEYPVTKEGGAPLTADDVRTIEAAFKKDIPGKEDLATQWFLIEMSKARAFFTSSLWSYVAKAEWFFSVQKDPIFKQAVQEYAEQSRNIGILNTKNLLSFNGFDIHNLQRRYKEVREIARVNNFPEKMPEGVELVYNDGTYRILEVSDADSACELSRGTEWCTEKKTTSEDYLEQDPLYVFYRGDNKVAQLHLGNPDEDDAFAIEFMNLKDKSMKVDDGIRQVLVNSGFMKRIVRLAARTGGGEVILDRFIGTKPNPEIAALCANSSKLAYYYADSVLHQRFPEGEKAIALNFNLAMDYARKYMQGRFPEAEHDLITRGRNYSLQYAMMLEELNPQQYREFVKEYSDLKVD